ncbi:reductase [Aeromicrobium sp. PE09-221]|nr:reductase [Aeromicrobium sp. PE09-221]
MGGVSTPVDPSAFRGALSRFASGVTVISTVVDGVDHAMTASAFTSVSLDPPLVLVCVDHRNRFHEAVTRARVWGVSILAEEGREDSAWFAHRGRELDTQFEEVKHHRGSTGVVLLDASLAWLECETAETTVTGDHTILFGRVVDARVNEGPDDPLLYYRSHYGTIVRSSESEKSVYGGPQ